MKNILIILFLFIGFFVKAQLTPVPDFRIGDASTAFGINIPIGTKIFNVATGEYFVADAALASTATLTTASGDLTQLNPDVYTSSDFDSDFATKTTDDLDEGVTNLYDQTVSFSGGTNVTIGGTYPSFTITDNTLSQSDINTLINDSLVAIRDTQAVHLDSLISYDSRISTLENVDAKKQDTAGGDKTASFIHYADQASIGNYNLSAAGAITVSIYNLQSGYQGTIFLDISTNPSSVTIAPYTDAGSTAIDSGDIRGSTDISTTGSEMTSITYTCVSDGTNLELILISSTGL